MPPNTKPQDDNHFEQTLWGMIESTEDFIKDSLIVQDTAEGNGILDLKADSEGRVMDLLCLEHVRKLYEEIFKND